MSIFVCFAYLFLRGKENRSGSVETKKDNNKAIFDVHFSTREEVSESLEH